MTYITMMEEAKKRDHRYWSKELACIRDYDADRVPVLPAEGMVLKNTCDYWRNP